MSIQHGDNAYGSRAAGEGLRSGLDLARQQLLDLGLRNNLLNYRLLKSRGVESRTPDPDELFESLVTSGRQIRFKADPRDPADEQDRPNEAPDESVPVTTLVVDAEEPELERRLLNTHDSARTTLEEQGLNTLFLTFGMLEWFEADSSQRSRFAPLILVPVELTRRDATSRFVLAYSGEEVGSNLSLEAKLDAEFDIKLPEFDAESDGALWTYLAALEQAIASQPRWIVHPDRVVLGQFSFNKFLMFHDLDLSAWPEEAHPLDHPVLNGLLSQDGFTPQPSNYSEDQFLDYVVSDDDHPMVVDADSSQTLALLDAIDGRTMVIQGPPGTGKSQTITNLIALALGQGKKILFVAEKMAALEVVKRRLDQLGLGDACLELHGTKTRKRRVLDDLNRTLQLGEPYPPEGLENQFQLDSSRSWLNAYCKALSEPVGPSGITAYTALGEVVKTRAQQPIEDWPALKLPGVATWDSRAFHDYTALVAEVQATRRQVGDPGAHPFLGVRRTSLSPVEQENLRGMLDRTSTALNGVIERNATIWERLRLEPKESPAAIQTAIATGKRAASIEAQGEIRYSHPAWHERSGEIESLLSDGKSATELRNQHSGHVNEDVWDSDLDELVSRLRRFHGSSMRWMFWSYWQVRREIEQHVTDDAPADFDSRAAVLIDVQRYQQLRATVERQSGLGAEMFGRHWNGLDSDWDTLNDLAKSAITLHRDIEREGLNSSLLDAIDSGVDRQALADLAEALASESSTAREQLDALVTELEFVPGEYRASAQPVHEWVISDQADLVYRWKTRFASLSQWVVFRRALRACHEAGLESIAQIGWTWPEAGDQLEDAFRYRCHLELVDYAWRTRPVLGEAGVYGKDNVRSEFSRLDQDRLRWNQALLARKHWEQLPRDGGGGELRVLTTEIQKKRRNLPIRELMKRAGNAVQAVKPVFMMSPLSVANFIPPGSLQFDLVVFDEASQVAPVDAFGAILRGSQAIVVGDDRQLPPTTFFERTMERDDLDDEDLVVAGDMQSILNLFAAQNAPQRMLRWHYRSQHESLIAVSNSEFYDSRLVVFPSPSREAGDLGLRLHHLPETVYDRGRTRTNVEEARAVAEAVMRHAREQPSLTLGVAAFSGAQAEAVRDHLEVLRRQDPSTESFFSEDGSEPFFVKSLENVQGDERDVIYISVGYGRDEHGRVTSNFGPVNSDGGERRLNVLITRARRRCEVFTNITDEDIPATSASLGVRALRTFLHYARTSEFPVDTQVGGEPASPFEEAVLDALQRSGYTVHCQVGSAGSFIDLAVVDPELPGSYLLAIECDGASYHSARSSRDRDRLRQQVLEGLGWTFHRIWSTDWFADPDAELERAIAAIEQAKERRQSAPPVRAPFTSPNGDHIQRGESTPITDGPSVPILEPYEVAQIRLPQATNGFDSLDDRIVARAIHEVAATESPIHREVLYRRITTATGLKRTGNRIKERINSLVRALVERNVLRVQGDFVWSAAMSNPPLRTRADLPSSERNLDLVAPEELDGVILEIVARSYSISVEEAARIVVQSLGLQRVTNGSVEIAERGIERLLQAELLREQDGRLVVPDRSA